MIGSRGAYRRVYGFEIIVLAHVLLIAFVGVRGGFDLRRTYFIDALIQSASFGLQACLGVAVRALWEAYRGRGTAYLHRIRSAGWLTDSARLVAAAALTGSSYSAIKLTVPLYHARIFDRDLWAIDRAICGGYSPNVFVLNLFSSPPALRFVDSTYAPVFFASLIICIAFFLSHPSRRIRVAFLSASTVLWLAGAWLYLLVPSVGPAYAYADVWLPYRSYFPATADLQRVLLRNYQNVLSIRAGRHLPVVLMYGIGAFPSLHVGFQTFVFLWMRRLWVYGEIVFGIFTLIIFLGSMITGWHYLVDALAGVALALLVYLPYASVFRTRRWEDLRRVIVRQ